MKTIITALLALVWMAEVEASNSLNFRVNDKDITFCINQNVAGKDIPNDELTIREIPLTIGFLKTESSHIGVNHNLFGWRGIAHTNLPENRLDGAAVETCKTVKLISSVGEKKVVHQHFLKQCDNTATIQQIVYFIDSIVTHIGIVFISAGARNTEVEHLFHLNPISTRFRHLFCHTLLPFKWGHICLASSRLRFM